MKKNATVHSDKNGTFNAGGYLRINSTNTKSKALAKSLYYYSRTANDYFA